MAALAAILALLSPGCGWEERPHLILLVIVDTLRADHLGCYGDRDIETPNIDRLAARGTVYDNAMSAVPVTLPSISTILTGAYPLQHGIRDNGVFALGESWETLPERLATAGFRTAGFVSADVLSHDHGIGQGFETYDDDMSARYETYQPLMKSIEDQLQGVERRAPLTVDKALEWAEEHKNEDAFLLVHLFDPHLPRDPPPEYRDRYPDRLYDGEIAAVDHEIGRLLSGLSQSWPESETLTILMADHGEGLLDHEEEFHGVLLFQETMHVPLIVAGPDVPAGQRIESVVRTADIPATVCGLVGIAPPPHSIGAPLPGLTLSDGTAGESRRGRFDNLAYLETFRARLSHGWCEQRGLRTPRWKLISGATLQLYDLRADPGEKTDLAASQPAVRDSLAALMDAVALQSLEHGREEAVGRTISQEERDRLFSLGYVAPQAVSPPRADSLAIWYFSPEERGVALGLSDPRERLEIYNQTVKARSFTLSGQNALAEGDLAEAERAFRGALHYDAAHVEAHLGLAEVFERNGEADRALLVLRHAAEENPADETIALRLSDALTKRGRRVEALHVLNRALAEGASAVQLRARRDSLRSAAGTE
ncbi:MAG: sulfatase-like hydrolase/transferase [Candidatus Eisenbacteria bacterium]|uniref:Sulfatase-like hydrolase/transferase n=1 Tax=Eiseniibacteriota bacterium TaxID=2212470 RepID=A0A956LWB2_UNCEI|nr:sulfatase-like hydrolase/transferase [Candidatus Eisenbacteria bacterium]